MTEGPTIADVLVVVATALLVAYGLWLLVGRLRAGRPGLAIGRPAAVALPLGVLAAAGTSLSGIGRSLRGEDEIAFLADADAIAATPFGSSEWVDSLTYHLHVFTFAAQRATFESPELAMRVAQVGIAVAGLVLLAVAVHELAGPRAATIAMWVMALEPTNTFFSSLLHKEANMTLAAGLVAFGGALVWKRGRPAALAPIALGCLVAVATRPYAGWFLIAASAAIVLHAGLRQGRESAMRSLGLVAVVTMLAAVAAPLGLGSTGDERLEQLQRSQDANASNNEANLSLERVDFSTREAIVTNLPRRVVDVLSQPYPWQLQNVNQQVGLLGTLVAYVVLGFLIAELVRARGSIMARAGPLIYLGGSMLIAYSLAAGNAGTAFRYRTHLVTIAVCLIVVLWQLRAQRADRREPVRGASADPARLPVPGAGVRA